MKKIFYISFDKPLLDVATDKKIKDMGPWFRYFGNNWLLETELSEKQIYDRLQTIGNEFRILIIEINIKSSWGWMPKDAWTWLNERRNKYQ